MHLFRFPKTAEQTSCGKLYLFGNERTILKKRHSFDARDTLTSANKQINDRCRRKCPENTSDIFRSRTNNTIRIVAVMIMRKNEHKSICNYDTYAKHCKYSLTDTLIHRSFLLRFKCIIYNLIILLFINYTLIYGLCQ